MYTLRYYAALYLPIIDYRSYILRLHIKIIMINTVCNAPIDSTLLKYIASLGIPLGSVREIGNLNLGGAVGISELSPAVHTSAVYATDFHVLQEFKFELQYLKHGILTSEGKRLAHKKGSIKFYCRYLSSMTK